MIRPEAEWFLKRQDPTAALETEEDFSRWVARPEHALRYTQCELMWERIGELSKDTQVRQWLDDLNTAAPPRNTRATGLWPGFAAAAGVVLAVSGVLTWQWLRTPVYETAVGELRDIRLEDGSRITLNTHSRVVVRYRANLRRIELERGEAIFDVHADSARPFEVSAGPGLTRALGTQFAVEHTAQGITVSVLDGLVEVLRNKDSARFTGVIDRGQALQVTKEGVVAYRGPANLKRIAAWQNRTVEFDGEPLGQAIAEINRYSPRRFVLRQDSLASLPISGVFHTTALDGFMFALRETLGLRVIDDGEEWLVLPPEQ